MITLILLVFAFCCFLFNAAWQKNELGSLPIRLISMGLACWVLSEILSRHPL